jgi:hypothetical protein
MHIEKMSYSRSPWRLINNNGKEVYWSRPMDHPDLGMTWVKEPVCGRTKQECIDFVLELLGLCFARLNIGVAMNPAAQPAVPDAIIEAGESPDYRDGWNDCRQTMLEMMK